MESKPRSTSSKKPSRGASALESPGASSSAPRPLKAREQQSAAPGTLSNAFLSCEMCRSKKIKCDKAEGGCTNCKKAGLKCVALNRQRLPRGRKGGRKPADVELKARIAKLENLVRTLESEKKSAAQGSSSSASTRERKPSEASTAVSVATSSPEGLTPGELEGFGRYMSPSFWHSLSTEVCQTVFAYFFSVH